MINDLLPLNSIVYCNSNSTTAEKCKIKSSRFQWQTNAHDYGYLVHSMDMNEDFNCPVDCMFMTAFQAKAEAEKPYDNLKHKYKSNIQSVEDLMNFSANHMRDVRVDESAIEAFKEKAQELLNINIK